MSIVGGDAVARPARRGESMWTREINVGGLERFVWPAVVALVVATLAATFLPMLWGWYPVSGRSMQPTLPVIGGYFKLEKLGDPARELRPNDIVVLGGQTLGYSIKRVAEIDPERGVYVLGDNVDRSKDSSFGVAEEDPDREVWIPFSEVKGRASDLRSLKRAWRSRTAEGRFLNELDFRFSPLLLQAKTSRYRAYEALGVLYIADVSAQTLRREGVFLGRDHCIYWASGDGYRVERMDPKSGDRVSVSIANVHRRLSYPAIVRQWGVVERQEGPFRAICLPFLEGIFPWYGVDGAWLEVVSSSPGIALRGEPANVSHYGWWSDVGEGPTMEEHNDHVVWLFPRSSRVRLTNSGSDDPLVIIGPGTGR